MLEYFLLPECGDAKFFACDRLSARLSVTSCVKMWREANDNGSERLFKCRNCPVGADHAGEKQANLSPMKGMTICSRCHRGATRLINSWLCVSCWNRQREFMIGKNAKGAKPSRMLPLAPRAITVVDRIDGVRVVYRQLTESTEELVVATLRDCKAAVIFTFCGSGSAQFSQRRLW